jgi:hypothetical protein
MDLTALVSALQNAIQQGQDEKAAKQADVDAKNLAITDLKTAIKDAQVVQSEDDVIVAAAQAFLDELQPFLTVAPLPVVVPQEFING